MTTTYERVKQAVPLEDALRFYGCNVGAGGMARCPFHGTDLHPSMNIKNNFFYCHTCGAHGDVIGLVAKLFGLRPSAAAVRLDNDFHLGLLGQRLSHAEYTEMQRQRTERETARAAFEQTYRKKTIIRQSLHYALIHEAPRRPGDFISDRYAEACRMIDYYDDWFAHHPIQKGAKD